MLPGMQVRYISIDLSWVRLGQARLQAFSQVQASSIYLHAGTQTATATVEGSFIHGSQGHGSLWRKRECSFRLLLTTYIVTSTHVPLTNISQSFYPSQSQQRRKYTPPIGKGTVKLHGKECGSIIPIHGERDPISARIISFKLLLFWHGLCALLDCKLLQRRSKCKSSVLTPSKSRKHICFAE